MSDKMQRFTQRARRALSLAQEEANRRNHSHIGPEHLLLGLMLEEGGVARRVLRSMGLDLQQVQAAVEKKTRIGRRHPLSRLNLSPEMKSVLESTIAEARGLGHHYIGTEHLLLGLVSHLHNAGVEALAHLKITPAQVRKQVNQVLQEPPPDSSIPTGKESRPPASSGPARFTQRARRVLSLAQEESDRLNHSTIDTEHLLLGLMREEGGLAAMALSELGFEIQQTRMLLERNTRAGQRAPFSKVDLSRGVKRVLELTIEEARRLGHHYIEPEHLLLALVSHNEGMAMDMLAALKITPDQVRKTIHRLIPENPHQSIRPRSTGTEPAIFVRGVPRPGPKQKHFLSWPAEQVLKAAKAEAAKLKRGTVDPIHVLIALIQSDGLVRLILFDLKFDADRVWLLAEKKSKPSKKAPPAKIKLSAETKKLLATAYDEARKLNHRLITREHLLLALAEYNKGAVKEAMAETKVTPDQIRNMTIGRLRQFGRSGDDPTATAP